MPMPTLEGYEILLFCFALLGASLPLGKMAVTSQTRGINEKNEEVGTCREHMEKKRRKQQGQSMEKKSHLKPWGITRLRGTQVQTGSTGYMGNMQTKSRGTAEMKRQETRGIVL